MKLAKPSLILLLLLGSVVAHAAPGTQPPASQASAVSPAESFKNGDTVCWVGDSITHGGSYHALIQLFYVTRFPDRDITYFNCGIGGDRASGIMGKGVGFRFKYDILSHKPTVATIMLGMNDINRPLYKPEGGFDEKRMPRINEEKATSITTYETNMKLLIEGLQAAGSRVILIQPSIYDETQVLPVNANISVGANAALGICAAKMKEWSTHYNAGLVDFYSRMNAINAAQQKKNPAFSVLGNPKNDRIHPGPPGHFVMAYAFLKDTGMTPWVAKMKVDGKSGAVIESTNCAISKTSASQGKVAFECLENSLPFPIPPDALKALDLVPFMKELNQEVLTVTNLAIGEWSLAIDGQACGEYSSQELATGVNLASNEKTPQYQQAAAILLENDNRMKLASMERNNVRLEHGYAIKLNDPAVDVTKIRAEIQKDMDAAATNPKTNVGDLKRILDTAARQAALAKEHEIAVSMRTAAKPKPHTYVLTPASGGK